MKPRNKTTIPKYISISNRLFFVVSMLIYTHLSACTQQTDQIKLDLAAEKTPQLKTEEEWKKILSKEQYDVLRLGATEAPFSGDLLDHHEKGTYQCAACKTDLFSSTMKFDSHSGWPSFDAELSGGKIKHIEDRSLGIKRTEIKCANCLGHLGHIFDDGPTETGKRYCVNSLALSFESDERAVKKQVQLDTLTLGGGCYWCVEAVYEMLEGVSLVESGYAGGQVKNPSYEQVCSGKTGHAEVVQLVFDPKVTTMSDVLKVFFTVHNPTTLNRQGADVGTQYRSVIFYRNTEQLNVARSIIKELDAAHVYDNKIVTELAPFKIFYRAEDYHQDYYFQNRTKAYCQQVIQPKIEKFEKVFENKLKKKK